MFGLLSLSIFFSNLSNDHAAMLVNIFLNPAFILLDYFRSTICHRNNCIHLQFFNQIKKILSNGPLGYAYN